MIAIWQGELLRIRRKQLGLTMAELATRVGCKRPLICIWEDSKSVPGGSFLVVLGKVLNVEPISLFLIQEGEQREG